VSGSRGGGASDRRALASSEKPVTNLTAVGTVVGGSIANAIDAVARNGTRHPLVFWPAFGTSIVNVGVSNNSAANCPSDGMFKVAYGQPTDLYGFPERCIYPLLTIQHHGGLNFSNPVGVNSTINGFGDPSCAPNPYAPTYAFIEGVGYTPGKDFFVACYDWRTTPFTDVGSDGAHLQRAQSLVEQAYNNSNGTKVYLMAHSNGPLYVLALLASMSAQWRQTYVAGFIPIAGNWIGQGSLYSELLSGQSLFDGSPNAASAPAFASWPSSYLSASFPGQYNDSETIIVHQGAKNYTPSDSSELYTDAGIPYAATLAPLFQGNMTPSNTSPDTNFYGFYGSGLPTLVGSTYSNLSVGASFIDGGNIYLDGDGNQEYIDNLAALEWNAKLSPCYHYELNEIKGVEHVMLTSNPAVLQKIANIMFTNPPGISSQCAATPGSSSNTIATNSG
ncbi:hypothetical protein WJX84_005037, partial [Apatococcus fuscideae]